MDWGIIKVRVHFDVEVPLCLCARCDRKTPAKVVRASSYPGEPPTWQWPDGWDRIQFAGLHKLVCGDCIPIVEADLIASFDRGKAATP